MARNPELALVLELLADLKAQIQQADNQAASRGAINLIDTLRAAKQTITLLEFELNKPAPRKSALQAGRKVKHDGNQSRSTRS